MTNDKNKDKKRVSVENNLASYSESNDGKNWKTLKVTPSKDIPIGVYILDDAKRINLVKTGEFEGYVLHADNRAVYQKTNDTIIRHSSLSFKKLPEVGDNLKISYSQGMVEVKKQIKQIKQTQSLKKSFGR